MKLVFEDKTFMLIKPGHESEITSTRAIAHAPCYANQ